jgi:hypothetical protein
MLLTLIVVPGALALQSSYGMSETKAFLIAGLLAILLVYWIPPVPKENYVRWIVSNSLVLFGLFLFLFKIPSAFSSFISYRSAQVLCTVVYLICCWFLFRLKKRSRLGRA